MKKLLSISLLLISLTLTFSGCSKDEVAPLFAIVTPDNTTELKTGQKQTYTIRFDARDGQQVRKLTVISSDKNNAELTLMDTTFAKTPAYVKYVFNAHPKYDGDVALQFLAEDELGNLCSITRYVKVVNETLIDNEINPSPVLCTADSANNAYDLAVKMAFPFVVGASEYKADLYVQKTEADGYVLRSDNGLSFVRSNTTFTYTNATVLMLYDVYSGVTPEDVVVKLAKNDVLVFGTDSCAKGVLLIKDIDEETNTLTIGVKMVATK